MDQHKISDKFRTIDYNFCTNLKCDVFGQKPNLIIVNSCKTTECENHGKKFLDYPELYQKPRSQASGNLMYQCRSCKKSTTHDEFIKYDTVRVDLTHKNKLMVFNNVCKVCDEATAALNNESVVKSVRNLYKYNELDDKKNSENSCKNIDCDNNKLPYHIYEKNYQKKGKNSSGNQKLKCKSCNKVFTIGGAKKTHKIRNKNIKILESIVNGLGIRRTAELNKISPKTVYDKIDYFYIKCLEFNRKYEDKYRKKHRDWINLATDELPLTTNWRSKITASKKDNVGQTLLLHATTDLWTGFLIDSLLNFDISVKSSEINQLAEQNNDLDKEISEKIYDHYDLNYDNQSNDYVITKNHKKLSTYGVGIRKNYASICHFLNLKHILKNTDNITIYSDKNSTTNVSIKKVFKDKILKNKLDHFEIGAQYKYFTHLNKKVVKKRTESEQEYIDLLYQHWLITTGTKAEYHKVNDEKGSIEFVKWATEKEEENLPKTYKIHEKSGEKIDHFFKARHATLHTTDNYFQMIRGMSFFGRKTATGTEERSDPTVWAYDKAYKPDVIMKLAEIYKTYYNFIKPQTPKMGLKKADCTTPAQRAKLTKKIFTFSDILNGKY